MLPSCSQIIKWCVWMNLSLRTLNLRKRSINKNSKTKNWWTTNNWTLISERMKKSSHWWWRLAMMNQIENEGRWWWTRKLGNDKDEAENPTGTEINAVKSYKLKNKSKQKSMLSYEMTVKNVRLILSYGVKWCPYLCWKYGLERYNQKRWTFFISWCPQFGKCHW